MTTTKDLRWIVTIKRDDGSFGFEPMLKFEAHLVEQTDQGLRTPTGESSWAPSPFEDLQVHAQLTTYKQRVDRPFFYGYGYSYRGMYDVDLRRAEVMVKTLRQIGKRMEKLEQTFGYPQDLGAFMTHLTRAIGSDASHPFGYAAEARRPGHTYDDSSWRWLNPSEFSTWLASEIAGWMKDKDITVKADES